MGEELDKVENVELDTSVSFSGQQLLIISTARVRHPKTYFTLHRPFFFPSVNELFDYPIALVQ